MTITCDTGAFPREGMLDVFTSDNLARALLILHQHEPGEDILVNACRRCVESEKEMLTAHRNVWECGYV